MTNPDYTDITFILDRSGSMSAQTSDVIGGFNSYVEEQKKVPGKCLMTVIQFDTEYEVINNAVTLDQVKNAKDFYVPRGATALMDAVGRAINMAGQRFSKMQEKDRPGRVLFVINTDGHENSSREFTRDQVKKMVQLQEQTYDWDFVFIGADFDVASEYGDFLTKGGKFGNMSKSDMVNGYNALTHNTITYRSCSLDAKNAVNFSE